MTGNAEQPPRIPPLAENEGDPQVVEMLNALPAGADGPVGSTTSSGPSRAIPTSSAAGCRSAATCSPPGRSRRAIASSLILRTAVRCRSSYEWGQHVRISLGLEIDRESIDRVIEGPQAGGWTDHEAALMRAVDELHDDRPSPTTPGRRSREATTRRQLIEATMLVGQYHMVAFALNSLGVQLDEGLEPLPGRSAG